MKHIFRMIRSMVNEWLMNAIFSPIRDVIKNANYLWCLQNERSFIMNAKSTFFSSTSFLVEIIVNKEKD